MDINLLDYFDAKNVILGIKVKSKKSIISGMLEHLIHIKKIAKDNKKEILKAIIQREEMGSTAIGNHIAFPHTRTNSIKDAVVCVGIAKEGVDFDSLDEEPVYVIALLLSNQKEAGLHLKMLAFLARILRDKYLVQSLRNAKIPEEVVVLLDKQQQAVR